MKKMMLVLMCVVVLSSLALAQYTGGGTGITSSVDILGAHNNYGRGCAGCQTPHSGALGSGGNAATGGVLTTDTKTGSNALFAQDIQPLFGQSFNFADNGAYVYTAGDQTTAYGTRLEETRGIMMCLACHDGNLAKGGMMKGKLWEASLLPAGVYGPQAASIPTLLGADGATGLVGANAYNNDHPVGPSANFGALRLGSYMTASINSTTFAISGITVTSPAYTQFVSNYGMPAIAGTSWSWGFVNPESNTNQNNLFITCTTCHNQHVMYIYKAPAGKQNAAGSGIVNGKTYPTYFFVNGAYNPGSAPSTTQASSAAQFCRQCHFGEANEAFGVNGVTTAF
jgi:hypothetical protein